jgi:hypothetical protein
LTSLRDGFPDRATGSLSWRQLRKRSQQRTQLDKAALDRVSREMSEAELFHAGRVDDPARCVDRIERGFGCRMAPGMQGRRDFADACRGARKHPIDQGRLAHA